MPWRSNPPCGSAPATSGATGVGNSGRLRVPDFVPTLELPIDNPSSQMVLWAMTKLPDHYGDEAGGSPLHRLGDPRAPRKNVVSSVTARLSEIRLYPTTVAMSSRSLRPMRAAASGPARLRLCGGHADAGERCVGGAIRPEKGHLHRDVRARARPVADNSDIGSSWAASPSSNDCSARIATGSRSSSSTLLCLWRVVTVFHYGHRFNGEWTPGTDREIRPRLVEFRRADARRTAAIGSAGQGRVVCAGLC